MNDSPAATPAFTPFHEPLSRTLFRSGVLAMLVAVVLALTRHQLSQWPALVVVVFWFTFGGHWLEILFLNWLRPRLPATRAVQITARIAVWFVGALLLAAAASQTATLFPNHAVVRWPAWWLIGVAFIGLELVVHLVLRQRGVPSFYDGRG